MSEQHEPTSEREALERYAEAHVGDVGHEPNWLLAEQGIDASTLGMGKQVYPVLPAPAAKGSALADFIFDTLMESNRLYVEQLRKGGAK